MSKSLLSKIIIFLTMTLCIMGGDNKDDDSKNINSVVSCNASYYDILYKYHKQCLEELSVARYQLSNVSKNSGDSDAIARERKELAELRATLETFKASLYQKKKEIEADYAKKQEVLQKRNLEVNIRIKSFNEQNSQLHVALKNQQRQNAALNQQITILMQNNVNISSNYEQLKVSYNLLKSRCTTTTETIDKIIDNDKDKPKEGDEDIGKGLGNEGVFERRM